MPEVYRGRKSRGRKSGRKSPRKYSKGRKSGRKSPRHSKGRNRFRGVTYRGEDEVEGLSVVDEFAAHLESEEMLTGYLNDVDLMIQQSEKLEDTIDAKSKWTQEEDAIIEEFANQAKINGKRVSWKTILKQLPSNRNANGARHRYERLQVFKARKSGQASSSYKPAPQ